MDTEAAIKFPTDEEYLETLRRVYQAQMDDYVETWNLAVEDRDDAYIDYLNSQDRYLELIKEAAMWEGRVEALNDLAKSEGINLYH